MNSTQLFALLTDEGWKIPPILDNGRGVAVVVTDADYEYLLRFCEVNRNDLINRLGREGSRESASVLIYRITQLLLGKWEQSADHRFINILFKFRAKKYLENLPKDAAGIQLNAKLGKTLDYLLDHD